MSQCVPKLYNHGGGKVKVELDLANYSTKSDLKEATGIDTSMLASKTDVAAVKAKVDELYISKLKAFPADLSGLSNGVENDVV